MDKFGFVAKIFMSRSICRIFWSLSKALQTTLWCLMAYGCERAVDKEGTTVDFMLSEKRDEPAARTFFVKAMALPLFNDL